jgi:hypothetical protein
MYSSDDDNADDALIKPRSSDFKSVSYSRDRRGFIKGEGLEEEPLHIEFDKENSVYHIKRGPGDSGLVLKKGDKNVESLGRATKTIFPNKTIHHHYMCG